MKIFSPIRGSASSRTRAVRRDPARSGHAAAGRRAAAADAQRMIFNDRLDAAVAAFFMISVS